MGFKMKEKQQQMKLAAQEFANGIPIEEVMNKYEVSYASVYNAIKRYNIDYNYTYGRTIFFNENYFEAIDTSEKAYWLGFIFADGSVVKTDKKVSTYNRLQINLSIKDKNHLEKFAQAINFPIENMFEHTPTTSYSCTPMVCLYCNSIKMATDLIKLGCIPNKTYGCNVPILDKNLYSHFIRGYFDGDGCISIKKVGQTSISGMYSFTSDEQFLLQLQQLLMENCNLNKTALYQEKNAVRLSYGGKQQLIRIYNYMYKDSTIHLQRKYDKFSLLFS